jgi:hypothetical protein
MAGGPAVLISVFVERANQSRAPLLVLAAWMLAILVAAQIVPGVNRPAEAATKAVDCADLAISFDDKNGYDLSCETETSLLADMDGSMLLQHLEATANDSSNFVDAFYYNLMGRVIYTATDLRANLTNFYGHLTISDWQSGRPVSTLTTAEFKTDMRGLPSHCIAYQKLSHRDSGGYKKVMIGVACSQGDINQSYAALKRLYLP